MICAAGSITGVLVMPTGLMFPQPTADAGSDTELAMCAAQTCAPVVSSRA